MTPLSTKLLAAFGCAMALTLATVPALAMAQDAPPPHHTPPHKAPPPPHHTPPHKAPPPPHHTPPHKAPPPPHHHHRKPPPPAHD